MSGEGARQGAETPLTFFCERSFLSVMGRGKPGRGLRLASEKKPGAVAGSVASFVAGIFGADLQDLVGNPEDPGGAALGEFLRVDV